MGCLDLCQIAMDGSTIHLVMVTVSAIHQIAMDGYETYSRRCRLSISVRKFNPFIIYQRLGRL